MSDQSEQDPSVSTAERRRGAERAPHNGQVSVSLLDSHFVGPGQNISDDGIFFVAESSLRVKVDPGDGREPLDGVLVRVQSMGDDQVGIAVRFVQ